MSRNNFLLLDFDPNLKAPLPQELGGTLQGFILKHKEKSAAGSVFSEVSLDANSRNHKLERLKVFTIYEIKVAAVNEKGPGPYSPLYRVTTGEKRKCDVRCKHFWIYFV